MWGAIVLGGLLSCSQLENMLQAKKKKNGSRSCGYDSYNLVNKGTKRCQISQFYGNCTTCTVCMYQKRGNISFFSSPGPKVQVNYCHHLASVVCKLFTFQASSPKPLGRLEPNLAGMFLGWSSTKLLFFVPVGYSIWLPRPIICSDWLKFQRSSSLKLMN